MNLFNNLFRPGTTSEENISIPLDENHKCTYNFLYTRKQWIQEKIIEHEIIGEVDTIISQSGENTFKWQVHLKNIKCKEKTNSIPEFYILWDCIQRVDFYTDRSGKIYYIDAPLGEDEIYKEKVRKIKQSDMDNNRKESILYVLKKIKNSRDYQKLLFEKNPVIILLCKNLDVYTSNNKVDTLSFPVHTYHSQEVIPDYFGEGIHLPIKKFSSWDKRNPDNTIAACVGGVDKNLLDSEKFLKYMKDIAGKVNTGSELFLDYSEYYQYGKGSPSGTENMEKAEIYMETVVADAWCLKEQTVLNNQIL